MKKIFVYGSLREGFFNYDLYLKGKNIEKLGLGYTYGKLFHMENKGYPALIAGKDEIEGEVFLVDDSLIADLHSLEGYINENNPKNLYNLEFLEVRFNDKIELLPTYIYNSNEDGILGTDGGIYIEDGSWKRYMESRG